MEAMRGIRHVLVGLVSSCQCFLITHFSQLLFAQLLQDIAIVLYGRLYLLQPCIQAPYLRRKQHMRHRQKMWRMKIRRLQDIAAFPWRSGTQWWCGRKLTPTLILVVGRVAW